jgi:hypothetical protein
VLFDPEGKTDVRFFLRPGFPVGAGQKTRDARVAVECDDIVDVIG